MSRSQLPISSTHTLYTLMPNSPVNAILLHVSVLIVEFMTLWYRSLWPIGGISPTYQYVLEMYAV